MEGVIFEVSDVKFIRLFEVVFVELVVTIEVIAKVPSKFFRF